MPLPDIVLVKLFFRLLYRVSKEYLAGDSACGQRALYQLGLTQIPIVNVNNKLSDKNIKILYC